MKQTFTRKDLRSGDIVELRNGSLGVVILEEDLIVYQFDGTDNLSIDFEENLTNDDHRLDIVKVYRKTMGFLGLEDEEPIYIREDINVEYKVEAIVQKESEYVNPEDLITILTQAFYGNRTSTTIKVEDIDRFILGYQSSDFEITEPIGSYHH